MQRVVTFGNLIGIERFKGCFMNNNETKIEDVKKYVLARISPFGAVRGFYSPEQKQAVYLAGDGEGNLTAETADEIHWPLSHVTCSTDSGFLAMLAELEKVEGSFFSFAKI